MSRTLFLKSKSIFYAILTACFVVNFSFSQTFQQFLNTSNLEKKCKIADELIVDYEYNDLDSLKLLGTELLANSEKTYNKHCQNYAFFILGKYLIKTAKEKEGIEYLNKAKNYFLSKEDFNKLTEIYNEIGNANQVLGRYNEACKWYEYSLNYGEKSTDDYVDQIARVNLAQAHNKLGEYEKAKEQAELYKDWVLKLGKFKSITNSFSVLGVIELENENYKQAEYYFEQSYKFSVRSDNYAGMGDAYTNLAIIKYYQEDIETSKEYFRIALELRSKVKNITKICDSYLNYGGILFEMSEFEKAEENYLMGLNIAKENKKILNEIELLQALKELYTEYDIEKLESINKQIDQTNKRSKQEDIEFAKLNNKLLKDLYLNDRMMQNGYLSKNSRWSFYFGSILLFLLSLYLIIRKKDRF
ncbi:MAG: tetratricopeptide repeat protein [Crocinitomicaceae bacterium]|nr:tetratricopeptide repeat protein [Crocinitomicaceae bacterium]